MEMDSIGSRQYWRRGISWIDLCESTHMLKNSHDQEADLGPCAHLGSVSALGSMCDRQRDPFLLHQPSGLMFSNVADQRPQPQIRVSLPLFTA